MGKFLARITRYTLFRTVTLLLAVVIAVYLTIIIANMGGELDKVRKSQITFEVAFQVYQDPANRGRSPEVLQPLVEELTEIEFERLGMNRPFFPDRSFDFLWRAMSLELGRSENMMSDEGSRAVRLILLERMPYTLLLFGVAELILFFATLFIALFLSRRYGSVLDRLTIALAPSSAAPGWFYGIFLILIFAAALRVMPWGGLVQIPPPEGTFAYALSVAKHMVLPVSAVVIGALFASIYSWRTFFLIYSSEDYVDLARAKGLSSQAIERRYIMRPALPPILTGFLLLLITMWMGQIVLESVFRWPGLGSAFYQATAMGDTPVIVGFIVIYGYLLAATVFVLDFIYAIVDPRVRVGPGGGR